VSTAVERPPTRSLTAVAAAALATGAVAAALVVHGLVRPLWPGVGTATEVPAGMPLWGWGLAVLSLPLAGHLVDRAGCRRAALLGGPLAGGGFALLPLTASAPVAIRAAAEAGALVGLALLVVAALGLVAHRTRLRRLPAAVGLLAVAAGAGAAGALLLLPALYDVAAALPLGVAAAGLLVAAGLLIAAARPFHLDPAARAGVGGPVAVLAWGGLLVMALRLAETHVALRAVEDLGLDPPAVSITVGLATLALLAGAAAGGAAGWLLGPWPAGLAASVLLAAALGAVAVAESIAPLRVTMAAAGLAGGAALVQVHPLAVRALGRGREGLATGLALGAVAVAAAAVRLLDGPADQVGSTAAVVATPAVGVVAALVLWAGRRRRPDPAATAPQPAD
jgi:hypothetical protein